MQNYCLSQKPLHLRDFFASVKNCIGDKKKKLHDTETCFVYNSLHFNKRNKYSVISQYNNINMYIR